jgi:DNA-directed RNA polymerase specialized sigma24 family protein
VVGVVLVLGSVGLYFAVRGPTGALNRFLSDLEARRDAHAWTRLCAADRRDVSQATFVSAWRHQRAKYGASIDTIDAFTFEPFGNVRHLHYRLAFRDDKVQANTYPVNVVREDGRWKVCNFFSLSRNPEKPGPLSGFQNW